MKVSKLLTTLAIASVVLIAGCNKVDFASEKFNRDSAGLTEFLVQPGVQGIVPLGVAGNFAILSKSGITNVPTSAITGDIGTSPINGASITGITCPEVTGIIYTVDNSGPACRVIDATRLTTAVLDMETAYTDAAGRAADVTELGAGDIGGMTLAPGVYKWSSNLIIPTDVTLSGGADDVWIFQVAGTLTMSSAVKIILGGGAQAKNIFWQVADVVTLGTTSHFEGIILGQTLIAMQTGASINGRLLAQTAVTLDQNTVNVSGTSGGGTNPPRPCRDFVTGGGWIKGKSDGNGHKYGKATFGVSGGMKNGKFWGHLSFNDHGKNRVSVKSASVTAYIQIDAVTRQIEGIAKVNGQGSFTYTVVVVDNGEPGRNDSFSLVLSNGYSASGTLKGGNIQIHKKCGESRDKDDKEKYYDKDERDGHNNCDNDKDKNNDDHGRD